MKAALTEVKGKWASKMILLFLATDILFILLHVLYLVLGVLDQERDPNLLLERDRGYAEVYQYVKEYWIVLLLGLLAVSKRSTLYLSWSLLFFYLLLDDSLRLHESLGERVSHSLRIPPMFGLRSVDFGELAVEAFSVSFFVCLIIVTYLFARDRAPREASWYLLLALIVLAIPGVIADMVHVMMSDNRWSRAFFTIVEDGGELVVMSGIVYLVLLLVEQGSLRFADYSPHLPFPGRFRLNRRSGNG